MTVNDRSPARIRGNAAAARVYRESHTELVREVFRGGGPLVDRLAAWRAADLNSLGRDAAMRRFVDETVTMRTTLFAANPTLEAQLILCPAGLATARGVLLPMLREPVILQRPLTGDVLEIIAQSPCLHADRDAARRFLHDACFVDGDRRYRTEFHGDQPRIHGERRDTVRALAAIAHELGHCLSEAGHVNIGAGALAASEAQAHLFEEEVVAAYFEAAGDHAALATWRLYQRRIDALNLAYFAQEVALIAGAPAVEVAHGAADVLREPLFSMPGYQAIYARASLARLSDRRADVKPAPAAIVAK